MVRGRRDHQGGADGRSKEGDEEDIALKGGDLLPALRERHGQQEREEHLHARQRHTQLVQELDQLSVVPLLRALSGLGAAIVANLPRAARYAATLERVVRFAAVAAAAVLFAPAAHAGVLLGVHGDAGRFAAQTGQQSQIHHTFMSFAQGNALGRIVVGMGPVPLLALNTGSYGKRQSATPRGLAPGQNDTVPLPAERGLDAWPGDRFYVRPFPEMNAHWAGSSAYNSNGTLRDAAHSTLWNRKALARIAVVLRGGTRD